MITIKDNNLQYDAQINFYNLFDYIIVKETHNKKDIKNSVCEIVIPQKIVISIPVLTFVNMSKSWQKNKKQSMQGSA